MRPALSALSSKNATSFLSIDDIVFVAHLQPEDNANLYERYLALAQRYHDRYSFAVTRGVRNQAAISCYNNPDDMQRSTAELTTAESLEEFVRLCSTPVIPELTRRNEPQYFAVRQMARQLALNPPGEEEEVD